MNTEQIKLEYVAANELKPHPKNYREHPADQLEHIVQSIKENGHYRNVVIAKDGTILAGHGVVKASKQLNLETLPVVRLDLAPDDPKAVKVLTGDNEIAHLGVVDDRLLSDLLKEVKESDIDGLLGTGYDDAMLANLVMVTRDSSEIKDFNAAAEWVGMPDFEAATPSTRLVLPFDDEQGRNSLIAELGVKVHKPAGEGSAWSAKWPPRPDDDRASKRIEG